MDNTGRTPDDTSRLPELLLRLEAQWREHDAPIARVLADGVSPDEAQSAVEPLGITLPDEVLVWLGWHNGMRPDVAITLPAMFIGANFLELLSLEQAIVHYRSASEIATMVTDPARPEEVYWDPKWFPLLSDNDGWMAADTSVPQAAPTPLRLVLWEFGDWIEPVTGSLTELVGMWVTALEERLWWFVPEPRFGGGWESDKDAIERRFGRRASMRLL